MSVQALSWVLEHSQARLAARLVLIAIANHADAHGCNSWPSVMKIAQEAHVTDRAVQLALGELQRIGELTIERNMGPHGTHRFWLHRMGEKFSPGGGENGSPGGENGSGAIRKNRPEPSNTKPPLPPLSKKGGAPRQLTARQLERLRKELQRLAEAAEGSRHTTTDLIAAACSRTLIPFNLAMAAIDAADAGYAPAK